MGVSYADLPRILAENKLLPADSAGHIRSPRWVPKGAEGAAYLAAWRAYCIATPKAQWPQFLREDIALMGSGRVRK
jgi:hypothetical protein